MTTGLAAFCIALIASLGFTVPVRAFALRVGMVDLPGPRKVHLTPMPLLGGLAMYISVVLAILLTLEGSARAQSVGILAGATLVAIVGFLDDRGLLHHQIKLFVGMPVAAVMVLATGIHANVFSVFVGGRTGQILDVALSLVWIVGITAAFSILDHMDGLCAGVAAVGSLFFVILAYDSGQHLVTILAAALLGSAMGFLRWNFKPAKIFMGDGGAMFLGFLMATLALKLRVATMSPQIEWLVPLLVLGVPIFDTTLVSISRLRRGLLPFANPGKDHAAHRLANLGLDQRNAVLAMYGAGIGFGALALLASRLSFPRAVLLAVLVAAAILTLVMLLERVPFERQSAKKAGT
ncbi:MAG TPA: MraY family glycosyltransferase [Candidatus Dormibacteraeota bacterium]|nr:MraY family glycosyltransferase [Candidatus Dormibacteraeota bacterium]